MAKRFITILRDKNVDALDAWNPTPTAQNLLTVRPEFVSKHACSVFRAFPARLCIDWIFRQDVSLRAGSIGATSVPALQTGRAGEDFDVAAGVCCVACTSTAE